MLNNLQIKFTNKENSYNITVPAKLFKGLNSKLWDDIFKTYTSQNHSYITCLIDSCFTEDVLNNTFETALKDSEYIFENEWLRNNWVMVYKLTKLLDMKLIKNFMLHKCAVELKISIKKPLIDKIDNEVSKMYMQVNPV